MVPFYDSTTAPFEETRYLVFKETIHSKMSTAPYSGMFNPRSSMFDFNTIEIREDFITTNRSKEEYWRFDNRHERRKERSLEKRKPKPSKRRHKFSK